jgi:5-methylcytosine-specific restriction endonuclease McrA
MKYADLTEEQKIKARNKVKKFRVNRKQKMVDAMGKKCQICGYDKTINALEFHHINPSEKEFSFGEIRASPSRWDIVAGELKKCILLCSNCHQEVHAGITQLPAVYATFTD